MWSDIPAILKALAVIVPAALAAMRYLRPGRLIGLTSAILERETYRHMAEHQERRAIWWQQQATECQDQLQRCVHD